MLQASTRGITEDIVSPAAKHISHQHQYHPQPGEKKETHLEQTPGTFKNNQKFK